MNPYECPGCGAQLDSGDLIFPIPDLEEKVLPGEPMPAGECPECGELVPAAGMVEED